MDCMFIFSPLTPISSTEFYLGFQKWLPKWLTNGFTTAAGKPVKNALLIRYISALLDHRARHEHNVRLQYVKGHAGHEGNEGADALAGQGAKMPEAEERNWEELEEALRAKETTCSWKEIEAVDIEVVDISDGELEVGWVYVQEDAEGLVDEDKLLNELDVSHSHYRSIL